VGLLASSLHNVVASLMRAVDGDGHTPFTITQSVTVAIPKMEIVRGRDVAALRFSILRFAFHSSTNMFDIHF
jgi:hypothetical protein